MNMFMAMFYLRLVFLLIYVSGRYLSLSFFLFSFSFFIYFSLSIYIYFFLFTFYATFSFFSFLVSILLYCVLCNCFIFSQQCSLSTALHFFN